MSVPSIYMVGGHVLGGGAGIFALPSSGGSGFYPAGHWVTSPQALTLMGPSASASGSNYLYGKAYPALAWSTPILAYGGAWPYVYSVSGTAVSAGLTVGTIYGSPNYGVLSWLSPTAGTYSYTVTVQDQALTSVSVTQSITVTTTGFVFVDATNGHPFGTGSGTIGSPYQTMADWYFAGTSGSAGRFDTTFTNSIVYYQSGSYLMTACYVDASPQGQIEMGNKPKIHLTVPGATVNFDPNVSLSGGGTFSYGVVSNVFFGGINFVDVAATSTSGMNNSIRISSGATDCVAFQCNWSTPSTTAIVNSNPGFMMCDQNNPSLGQRITMSQCTFQSMNGYDLFLGYYAQKVMMVDNVIQGVNNGIGFYPKLGTNDTWTVRGNVGLGANGGNSQGSLCRLDNYNGTTNLDYCWNNYASSSPSVYFGPDGGGTGISGIAIYRNTDQSFGNIVDGSGATIPVTALTDTNNVRPFTNSSANAEGYQLIPSGASLSATYSGTECVGLNGAFVTAATGNLTGTFRTNYLGLRGHEVA